MAKCERCQKWGIDTPSATTVYADSRDVKLCLDCAREWLLHANSLTLTEEEIKVIEARHYIYIDAGTMQFNPDGSEQISGWKPIPHDWIDEIKQSTQ